MASAPELPHTGVVHLVFDGTASVLAHAVTGEKVHLGSDPLSLHFSGDYSYIRHCAETKWCTAIFDKSVHVSPEGRRFVYSRSSDSVEWLDVAQQRRTIFYPKWEAKVGEWGFSFECKAMLFEIPCEGCCVYWDLRGVQRSLHLHLKDGNDPRWLKDRLESIYKGMQAVRLPKAHLKLSLQSRAAQAAHRGGQFVDLSPADSVFLSHSASTVLVIWLLAHWGLHLKDAQDRLSCRSALLSFLGRLLRPGRLLFTRMAEPAPAGLDCCRRSGETETVATLTLNDECKVDIAPMLECGQPAGRTMGRLLNASRMSGSSMTLADLLLLLLGGGKHVAFILVQLLWQLAFLVEESFVTLNFNQDVLQSNQASSGRVDAAMKEEVVMGAIRNKLARKPKDLARVAARVSNGRCCDLQLWTHEAACVRSLCIGGR